MSFFSLRNIIIFGFLLLLLIGIPVGVYLVQQQQEPQTQAEQSSILSFVPTSSESGPIEVEVGDEVKLDITVNPGSNKVSVVAFEINYDPAILGLSETTPFAENKTAFPVIMDPPVYEEGIIRGKVSTQSVQNSVSTQTKVATITFIALEETTVPTAVTYGAPLTQILSAGGQDEAGENVLSSTTPAYVLVSLPEGEPEPTDGPTTPSVAPTASPGNSATNQPPVCTSLTANGGITGVLPFAASLTAVGSDSDGGIIKATFNFGDGQTADALHSGVSSQSATITQEHTYATAGTHRASVLFTDNLGGVSAQGSCVVTFTITSPVSPTPEVIAPTLEPTGPNDTFIGIGIVAGIITFLGGLFFFSL